MARKADGTEDNSTELTTEDVAFVTMTRDPDIHPAPHTAQVHPDEVHNYYSGGWVLKKEEAE